MKKKYKYLIYIFLIIILYTLVFTILGYLKYKSFHSNWSIDLALHNQALWNTVHGNFLYKTVLGPHTRLFDHFSPFILFLSFFYMAYPHIITLFFLLSLGLGLGAFPVFLLTYDKTRDGFCALVFSLIYLFYPPLHLLNLNDFFFEPFCIPLFLFMFYFFEKKMFKAFLVSMFLILSIQEHLAITTSFFGFYALIRGRSKKWVFTPLFISIIWFSMAMILLKLKTFYGFPSYHYFSLFGAESFLDLLNKMFLHPLALFSQINLQKNVIFFFELFASLFLLSFFCPLVLFLALPSFLIVILSGGIDFYSSHAHYISSAIPFIVLSAVYSLIRIKSFFKKDNCKFYYAFIFSLLVLIIFLNFTSNRYFLTYNYSNFKLDQQGKDVWELIKQIPAEASVGTNFDITAALSERKKLTCLDSITLEGYLDVDYILLDIIKTPNIRNDGSFHINEPYPEYFQLVNSIFESPNWTVISKKGNFVLFKKNIKIGWQNI